MLADDGPGHVQLGRRQPPGFSRRASQASRAAIRLAEPGEQAGLDEQVGGADPRALPWRQRRDARLEAADGPSSRYHQRSTSAAAPLASRSTCTSGSGRAWYESASRTQRSQSSVRRSDGSKPPSSVKADLRRRTVEGWSRGCSRSSVAGRDRHGADNARPGAGRPSSSHPLSTAAVRSSPESARICRSIFCGRQRSSSSRKASSVPRDARTPAFRASPTPA